MGILDKETRKIGGLWEAAAKKGGKLAAAAAQKGMELAEKGIEALSVDPREMSPEEPHLSVDEILLLADQARLYCRKQGIVVAKVKSVETFDPDQMRKEYAQFVKKALEEALPKSKYSMNLPANVAAGIASFFTPDRFRVAYYNPSTDVYGINVRECTDRNFVTCYFVHEHTHRFDYKRHLKASRNWQQLQSEGVTEPEEYVNALITSSILEAHANRVMFGAREEFPFKRTSTDLQEIMEKRLPPYTLLATAEQEGIGIGTIYKNLPSPTELVAKQNEYFARLKPAK